MLTPRARHWIKRSVTRWRYLRWLIAVPCGLLVASRSRAQVIITVSEDTFVRLGTVVQFWADETQDPVSGGYSQNLFLRRIRLIVAGQLSKNVTFFCQTDNPRLGNANASAGKNLATAPIVQDAFGEGRIASDLVLDAGLFFVPQSRNIMTTVGTTLAFDVSTFGLQQSVATQSSGGRDLGLQLKGYLGRGRLEYRAGVFAGQRQSPPSAAAGARNAPRYAGRLQYDALDIEKGSLTYPGSYRGTKRIFAIGAWGDRQGHYRAWGMDAMADVPVAVKNALTGHVAYFSYDGRKQFMQITNGVSTDLLPGQQALFADAGYYLGSVAIQPFLRYECLRFADPENASREQTRYGAGANWYVAGTSLEVSILGERIAPRVRAAGAARKDTNRFAMQLHVRYY